MCTIMFVIVWGVRTGCIIIIRVYRFALWYKELRGGGGAAMAHVWGLCN